MKSLALQNRKASASISATRWTAYARAAGAAAITGAGTAEATIMYSGPINHSFNAPAGMFSVARFPLDQPGDSIGGQFSRSGGGSGAALFFLHVPPFGTPQAVAGFIGNGLNAFQYASKLSFGQQISRQPFVAGYGRLALPTGAPGPDPVGSYAQWQDPGSGFVGFRFNVGDGFQYGWARINTEGAPGNVFTLIDYAFADPGERITAGQTSSASVPESGGSLGLLALGCAGLLAWRAARRESAPA